MVQVSPATAGFLKGLFLAAVLGICVFLENSANLTGILNPTVATIVVALASSIESHLKAGNDGQKGLFGAIAIRK